MLRTQGVLTVLVSDNALSLADALLGLLNDVVWGVVWEADNDRSLRSDSHGGSGKGEQGREDSEAHYENVDRAWETCERAFYQRCCSVVVVKRGVVGVIRKVLRMPGESGRSIGASGTHVTLPERPLVRQWRLPSP